MDTAFSIKQLKKKKKQFCQMKNQAQVADCVADSISHIS